MKFKITFLAITLTSLLNVYSQSPKSLYEVGTWSGFRSSAISYTFDDGSQNQYDVAVPIFNKYGYKLTLFTISNRVSDWSKLKRAAAEGHEIANHTVSHPKLNDLSIDQQRAELENCSNTIKDNISGLKGLTHAYPYCITCTDSIVSRLFISARGGSGVIESSTPKNILNVSALTCGDKGPVNSAKTFNAAADKSATSNGWLVYIVHAVDNEPGYSPLSSAVMDSSLLYLKNNDSKFWVESFGNVSRYIKERNSLSIAEKSVKKDAITLTVKDTLDDKTFNYPISIRRPLPQKWESAEVLQNGKSIFDKLYKENNIKYIVFNAVPDGGDVVLKQSKAKK